MDSPPSSISAFHHAQITIPPGQEDAARAFYVGVLSLTEIPKPESLRDRGGFWLSVGSQQLHIGVEGGVDREATKAHLAYAVTNLKSWRETLNDTGIDVVESVPIPGCERFEFRDPFGNRVEMVELT